MQRLAACVALAIVNICHGIKWNHWEKGVEFAEGGDNAGGMYTFRHGLRAAPFNAGLWHALAISQWNLAIEEHNEGSTPKAATLLRNAAVALKRCLALNTRMSAAHRDMPTIKRLMHAWGMHNDVQQLNLDSYLSGSEWEGFSSDALPVAGSLAAALQLDDELHELHELLQQENAPQLPELDGLSGGVLQQAELFLEAGYVQHAVHSLCSDEGWVLHVPPEERNMQYGTLPPHLAWRAHRLLHICGLVVIRHSMPPDALRRVQAHVQGAASQRQIGAQGATEGSTDSPSVPVDVLADDAIALNPWFMPAASGGLRTSRLEVGAASLAPPQSAADEGVHLLRDEHILAGALDGYAGSVLDARLRAAYGDDADDASCQERARAATHPQHGNWNGVSPSPAVGVHVVLPLGDSAARKRGVLHATAGSHMQCIPHTCSEEDEHKCPHEGPSMEEVRLGPGDALLLDSRLHTSGVRGPWSTLLLTLNQEWYRPPVQQSEATHQTSTFSDMPVALQSLFTRVDALKATQSARSDLQDMFVDVDEMESQYEFDAYDYDESSFFADMDLSAAQYRRKMDPVIHGYRMSSNLIEQQQQSAATLPSGQHRELS